MISILAELIYIIQTAYKSCFPASSAALIVTCIIEDGILSEVR